MNPSPSRSDQSPRREALVVAALTAAGGLLRLWSIGRLGLVHFDEGIYAMAGTWAMSPRGLGGLDPTLISYAPPGFVFLVGLFYGLIGASDVSAILVSIVAGTLTIPVAGWLAYRSFGRGAGAAASAFAALAGPHVAFSRMALTDVSFLLFWLIAVGQGQRFVERPGPARAGALGIAVGVAQLFKYNGWLAGIVVALGAATWTVLHREEWTPRKQARLWGWGAFAAIVAAVVYWPWFRFVESHGGYAALLAHQRGYMGGVSSWPDHALVQLEQDRALSGGLPWMAFGGLAAAIATLTAIGGAGGPRRSPAIGLTIALSLTALCSFFHGALFGAVLWMIVFAMAGVRTPTPTVLVLALGWIVLALLTPFYHPYARLLLPLQGFAWLLLGGAFAIIGQSLERVGASEPRRIGGVPRSLLGFAAGCWLVPLVLAVLPGPRAVSTWSISEILEPSDSLRQGCRSLGATLLKAPSSLRLYARPPVTFYLSGVVPVAPQPTLEALLAARDPGAWALLDAAMVRQGGGIRGRLPGLADRWDLVREIPTTLNLPTLLDVDPSAAASRSADRSAPLLLFRPKPPGASR
jgi:4-amino-4-deoxy-L-arabinose transferase-like glycosyltransferase